MKTRSRTEYNESILGIFSPLLPALLLATLFLGPAGLAQEQGSTASASKVVAPTEQAMMTQPVPSAPISTGVNEILMMADAGVATEVIKAYVECSPTVYQLKGADIIALKKHNVADEVVTLLLKRGAQDRAVVAQAKNDALTRALNARRMSVGGWDPEGYDYFRNYYLQPRALASAYERLSPYYYRPFFPGYGYPFRR